MRILYAVPLLLLAACQVSKDDRNDTTTVAFNEDVADNALNDVENAAESLANDAQTVGGKIENRVDKVDVNVDLNTADKDKKTN